jgi:chromosome segregation ATPase
MLDAFRKAHATQQQIAELQALVAASRDERAALSMMLTQLHLSASRAGSMAAEHAIDHDPNGERLRDLDARLSSVTARLDQLSSLPAALADLRDRVAALSEATARLTLQMTQVRGSVDALRRHNRSLDELRQQLEEAHSDMVRSADAGAALTREVEQLRESSVRLAEDFVRMRAAAAQQPVMVAQLAPAPTDTAAERLRRAVQEIESRIASLPPRTRTLPARAETPRADTVALLHQRMPAVLAGVADAEARLARRRDATANPSCSGNTRAS